MVSKMHLPQAQAREDSRGISRVGVFVISICYPVDGFLGFRDMLSRLCNVRVEPIY
jgi:hypothetical protein